MCLDVFGELADIIVTGFVGHGKPRVGPDLVSQRHHDLNGPATRAIFSAPACLAHVVAIFPVLHRVAGHARHVHEANDLKVFHKGKVIRVEQDGIVMFFKGEVFFLAALAGRFYANMRFTLANPTFWQNTNIADIVIRCGFFDEQGSIEDMILACLDFDNILAGAVYDQACIIAVENLTFTIIKHGKKAVFYGAFGQAVKKLSPGFSAVEVDRPAIFIIFHRFATTPGNGFVKGNG